MDGFTCWSWLKPRSTSMSLTALFFYNPQVNGWSANTPSSVSYLYGCMRASGPPCRWWVGETTPQSPLGLHALWTGGWHRHPCLVRALSCPSCSSVSSSPRASLSFLTSWSSSKSSLLPRRCHTLTPASQIVTTWRWNSQRCVSSYKRGFRERDAAEIMNLLLLSLVWLI